MKNTIIKKAIACMTSLMAVSALSVSMASYAVDTPTINNPPANKLETAQREVGIPVNKDIVLFNVDESQILSPNIIYSYEVTPANISGTTPAKITTYAPEDLDTDGKTPKTGAVPITVTVKSGVLAAISTVGDNTETTTKKEATISFGGTNDIYTSGTTTYSNNNVTKHATNKESVETVDLTKKVRNSMTITVDANKIYDPDYDKEEHTNTQVNGPGVYRYKIEDVTTGDTLKASGIDRKYHTADGDTDKYVYLDVYTKYNEQKNGLVVYGYVLLKDVTDKDNVDVTYNKDTTGETLKVTGFDTESENKDKYNEQTCSKGELTSDAYHTYNVEVSKKTEGDLADTQNNFPFKVELTNTNTVTSLDDFYYVITKDGTAQSEVITNLSNAGAWTLDGNTDTNLRLQNGDKIVITGLPVKTSIKVTETNNTADTYSVSATNLVQPTGGDTTAAITLKGKAADDTDITGTSLSVAKDKTAEMSAALEITKTDKGQKIVFTNTLKDISVTGLLFNIAPFIFITAAGVVLITLFMRNKKKDNADNMI